MQHMQEVAIQIYGSRKLELLKLLRREEEQAYPGGGGGAFHVRAGLAATMHAHWAVSY